MSLIKKLSNFSHKLDFTYTKRIHVFSQFLKTKDELKNRYYYLKFYQRQNYFYKLIIEVILSLNKTIV